MSRIARERRVYFFEEPIWEDTEPDLRLRICEKTGVRVLTPVMRPGLDKAEIVRNQGETLRSFLSQEGISKYISWYYTPMALEFSADLTPQLTVYDCMDELSAFAGAPPTMRRNEEALFERADLVFTGGHTLYEWKRKQHGSVHLYPSSVDVQHFAKARNVTADPPDQAGIATPRLGYAGVIDERMDLELIGQVAQMRPEWQFVFLGPVAKIDAHSLPRSANIHYLGMKSYSDLPSYFAGWRIGMLPFALNESTRFISPTKTPEYLAAGLHVISSPIRDVVRPYGDLKLARIASTPGEFVSAAEDLLSSPTDESFRMQADAFLAQSSWDKTWSSMKNLMEQSFAANSITNFTMSPSVTVKGVSHV